MRRYATIETLYSAPITGAKLEEQLTKSQKNSLFANAQEMAQSGPNRSMGSQIDYQTLIVGDIDPSAVAPREGPLRISDAYQQTITVAEVS